MVEKSKTVKVINNSGGAGGFVLFVAFIGALVYFVEQADGFWQVILAFLQAIVWPAFVLYHVLQILGA